MAALQVSSFVEEYPLESCASPQFVSVHKLVKLVGGSENLSSYIVTLVLSDVDVERDSTILRELSLEATR